MTLLRTNRLVLREFTLDDAPAMEAVFCDPDVMAFSDRGPRTHAFVRT